MKWFTFICSATVLAGCSKPDARPAADTTAVAPAATLSLADLAGTWSMRAMHDQGDSTLITYQIGGTADPSTWKITFPNRPPITLRVSISGDSMISDAGPYESVLRKGVVVSTHTVSRLQDGKLVGSFVAKYATRMVDSTLTGRVVGTKMP